MSTWITLMPLATAGALLLPLPVQAQISDPASLKRIRAALAEPPPILQVPPPSGEIPTFRVEVRQQAWTFDPLDENTFDPTYGLPSVGELVVGGIGKIKSAAVNYRHGAYQASNSVRSASDEAAGAPGSRRCPRRVLRGERCPPADARK